MTRHERQWRGAVVLGGCLLRGVGVLVFVVAAFSCVGWRWGLLASGVGLWLAGREFETRE